MYRYTIHKSHSFITSAFKLRLYDLNLFDLILGKVPHKTLINSEVFYNIDVSDFAEKFNITDKYLAYKQLKLSMLALMKETYRIAEPNSTKVLVEHFLDAMYYDDKEHTIQVKFKELTASLVSDLDKSKGYLSYELKNKFNLSSIYSSRFYELFKAGLFKGKVSYSLEEIKTMLCLSDSYNLYGNLKAKIITPSLEDINKNTDIYVELVKEAKAGNKVIKLVFFIKAKVILYDGGMSDKHKVKFQASTGINVDENNLRFNIIGGRGDEV